MKYSKHIVIPTSVHPILTHTHQLITHKQHLITHTQLITDKHPENTESHPHAHKHSTDADMGAQSNIETQILENQKRTNSWFLPHKQI